MMGDIISNKMKLLVFFTVFRAVSYFFLHFSSFMVVSGMITCFFFHYHYFPTSIFSFFNFLSFFSLKLTF